MTTTFEPAPTFPPPHPPAAPPKQRRWGRIILIVGAAVVALIVALVVGLLAFVNSATKDAQKVSDQLVTAIQTGDGAKAYALAGADFREITTEKEVAELATGLSQLVTREKASPDGKAISASTDRGKVAVFTYTLEGTSGQPVYFKAQVHEQDGRWRVLSFKSSDKKLAAEVE